MGGKALLPQVPTIRRLDGKEYKVISVQAMNIVRDTLELYSSYIKIIPHYSKKDSFGDCDILVRHDGSTVINTSDWRKRLEIAFGSKAVHHTPNSQVTSFEYKDFQIDIIMVPGLVFDFSFGYYAYNDLGCLLGVICKKMGLSLKSTGLFLPVYFEDQRVTDLLITNSWLEALAILGCSGYKYGVFNELTDVFGYAVSSSYFSKELFPLENLNSENRNRNAARPNYMLFLDYITPAAIKNNFSYDEGHKTPWMDYIIQSYPSIVKEYRSVIENCKKTKLLKSKFNGGIVIEQTGLAGKEVGIFLEQFKGSFKSLNEFEVFVMSSSKSTIIDRINEVYEQIYLMVSTKNNSITTLEPLPEVIAA